MAANIPLLIAGAALLLLGKKKKRKTSTSIAFEDEKILAYDESKIPKVVPSEVGFSPDLSGYKIGGSWNIKVLDNYLNKRRLEGKLATVDHDAGWLYNSLIDDPTTWLGDVTRTGKLGGEIIYSGLWLMATVGIGIYASGFAAAGGNLAAATEAASATRAMQILGPKATEIAGTMYARGFGSSQIALALKDFGGMQALARFGVGEAIAKASAGAVSSGVTIAAGILTELGVDEAFSPDVAASAVEAAADFTKNHSVTVAAAQVPIALLPSSDEYPAIQDFNKHIMKYIIGFQKRHFED